MKLEDVAQMDISNVRILLQKFEGDDTTKPPIETLEIYNGEIVRREVADGAH